jgi:hypothetical protein
MISDLARRLYGLEQQVGGGEKSVAVVVSYYDEPEAEVEARIAEAEAEGAGVVIAVRKYRETPAEAAEREAREQAAQSLTIPPRALDAGFDAEPSPAPSVALPATIAPLSASQPAPQPIAPQKAPEPLEPPRSTLPPAFGPFHICCFNQVDGWCEIPGCTQRSAIIAEAAAERARTLQLGRDDPDQSFFNLGPLGPPNRSDG